MGLRFGKHTSSKFIVTTSTGICLVGPHVKCLSHGPLSHPGHRCCSQFSHRRQSRGRPRTQACPWRLCPPGNCRFPVCLPCGTVERNTSTVQSSAPEARGYSSVVESHLARQELQPLSASWTSLQSVAGCVIVRRMRMRTGGRCTLQECMARWDLGVRHSGSVAESPAVVWDTSIFNTHTPPLKLSFNVIFS